MPGALVLAFVGTGVPVLCEGRLPSAGLGTSGPAPAAAPVRGEAGAAREGTGRHDGQPASGDAALRHAMLVAEDARPTTRAEAAPLLRGLRSSSPDVVRLAVRGLGRLERPEFMPELTDALTHRHAAIRAEAANAIAQCAAGAPASTWSVLAARLDEEHETVARAALLDALGRLPNVPATARTAIERKLVAALAGEYSPLVVRHAAARGLESQIRLGRRAGFSAAADTLAVLREAALGLARPNSLSDEARVRRVAVLALNAAGAADATYERLMADRDEQVRRLVVAGASTSAPGDVRTRVIRSGLTDGSALVRYEAVRAHARHLGAVECGPELAAVDDPNVHVALLALDVLATVCPANAAATERLAATSATLPAATRTTTHDAGHETNGTWHRAAHALVALARRAPERIAALIGPFSAHGNPFVRVYAARAATLAKDGETLVRQLEDEHPIVRAAAVEGLRTVAGHEADARYLAALNRPDYPVVLAVTRALEGAPARRETAAGLVRALQTLTREGRDTSRDARLAILERLGELGGPADAAALRPFLADPDPRMAARAGELLVRWTGEAVQIRTTRLATLPVPAQSELDGLPTGLRVTMGGGRRFEIRLRTDDAPVTVWRVARLVARGYYDGLTFHRIVPGFVIQGGSPSADEFVGDGPFMRDELTAASHDRGTLGISTRGRDTGDAQWFVNLVDNVRLDHDFTVFGEVVAGLEVVDSILEGDVMVTVEAIHRDGAAGQGSGR